MKANVFSACRLILMISALSLAVPAQGEEGRPAKGTAYDNWTVNCDKAKQHCSAALRVIEAEPGARTGKVAMVWSIRKDAKGALASAIETRTGLLLQPGVSLKIGDAAPQTLPFVYCTPSSCTASGPLDDRAAEQAIGARHATIVIQGVEGKAYTYSFSPKGIDKALSAVR